MSTLGYSHGINPRKARDEGHLTTSFIGLLLILCTFLNTVSCRSAPLSSNIVASEGEHGYNEPQGDRDESEFGWELSTDNVELYEVIHALDLETIVRFLETSNKTQDSPQPRIQRYKRSSRVAVFGKDSRKQVSSTIEAQMLPYVASVRISSGCSGTLVGPKHILTAAHCVFRGSKRKAKRKLKVGFLQRSGKVRWRKVRRVHAPREWRTLEKKKDRMKHDYAVLELKREHGRSYMKPVPYDHHSVRSVLQFNGFPGDKKINTMWHTRCPVFQRWHGYLINKCVVTKGMSGSGAYQLASRGSYTTTGLIVAAGRITIPGKRTYRFNVVNPLTHHKRNQICRWMKAGKDCKSFRR